MIPIECDDHLLPLLLLQWFSECVPRSAPSASPGNILGMQIIGLCSRPIKSRNSGMGPSNLYFNKLQWNLIHTEVWEPLYLIIRTHLAHGVYACCDLGVRLSQQWSQCRTKKSASLFCTLSCIFREISHYWQAVPEFGT